MTTKRKTTKATPLTETNFDPTPLTDDQDIELIQEQEFEKVKAEAIEEAKATIKPVDPNLSITYSGDDLRTLDAILTDYKGFVEYTYRTNVTIIAQWEQMLKTSSDKAKTIELIKGINEYKKQAAYLDIARSRADQLHQKLAAVLPDSIYNEGNWEEWTAPTSDDNTADEPSTTVSEAA